MSLLDRHECPTCFGLTGWVGERARRNPLRAHVACKCEEAAEQLTEVHGDPFLKRRAA